jgi:hypothetical protein
MYPYRVFVSYSHDNQQQATEIRGFLEGIGARPMSDVDLPPGVPFPDEIKRKIAYAHVFIPLLTESSGKRPWVHQEIGYAMGLGVPILPLALGKLPEGMTEQVQAVQVSPDLSDLPQRLSSDLLASFVSRSQETPCATFQCADQLFQRTQILVAHTKEILQIGQAGRVLQRSAFSSFSLPNKRPKHPDWDERDGDVKCSLEIRELLRQEREVMEAHARKRGCDLIIDPYVLAKRHGKEATTARLRILREFLESMPDDRIRVAIQKGEIDGSLIIVDDWFVAEAVVPRYGVGYMQTILTRHAPTVLRRSREFGRDFEEVLAELELAGRSSREAAIDTITGIMGEMGKA